MTHAIHFTTEALQDLRELDAYITEHDSPEKAERVLARIEELVHSLAESPERGAIPPELIGIGNGRFREVFFKPYRVVYRVWPDRIVVLLVADGRRDLRTLLQRRLFVH